jgi:cytochrome c oxidase assembly factor CtaG
MRRPSRTTALIAVVLWFVVGPVAAVFGACAAMGAMCEGPCGVGPCAILLLVAVTPVLLVLGTTVPVMRSAPTVFVRLLDPPPRPLVLSF